MAKVSPRRSRGTGSVYRVAGGWQASVSFTGPDGQRKRKRRTKATAEDAYAELAKLRDELAAGDDEAEEPASVREFLEGWLVDVVEPNSEAATYDNYRATCENHVINRIGDIAIRDLVGGDLVGLLGELHRDGASGRTRAAVYSVLHVAFEHAINVGAIEGNPLARVRKPKHERKPIRPFTADQVRAIIAEADRRGRGALMALAFSTGLRSGELFALQWGDWQWTPDKIRVERAVSEVGGKLTVKRPKNRASVRTLDLCAEVIELLAELRGPRPRDDRERIFVGGRGASLRRSTFGRSFWHPALKACGLDQRGFHHTRHTFATLALTATPPVPVQVVARVLGHASADRTLRSYGHYVEGGQASAVRAVAEVLAGY